MTETEIDHIKTLENKVKALETEAAGGRDLNALSKAEKDFKSFDIRVIKLVLETLEYPLEDGDKAKLKKAFVDDRYAREVSKNVADEWGE